MGKLSSAEVLGLRATSAVSRDRCVRRSVQDDGCAEGLKHIRPGVRKTRKIEKVTGSERSASRIYRVTQRLIARSRRTPRVLVLPMLFGAFQPPKPENRILPRYSLVSWRCKKSASSRISI